jgi:hypothetical protein
MHLPLKSLILAAALAYSGAGFGGEVSRALFTIGVDNREPVIMVDSINSGSYTSISFFTELNDMSGQTATHQWTYNDKVMFEKTFEVKAERWRVWTSKTLIPDWKGTWTVNVLDDDRVVVSSKSFEYL